MRILIVLMLLMPAVAAYEAGSTVGRNDYDHTPMAKAQSAVLCYMDHQDPAIDKTNGYDAGEPIYIHFAADCTGKPVVEDFRIIPYFPEHGQMSEVEGEDQDQVYPFAGQLTHALRYWDMDDDTKFKGGKDALYIDIFDIAGKTVSNGDVRLTAEGDHAPFTVVTRADDAFGMPLSELKGAAADWTTTNAFYKANKEFYINIDLGDLTDGREAVVEEHDVRLLGKAEQPWSDVVAPSAPAAILERPELDVVGLDATRIGDAVRVEVQVRNTDDHAGAGFIEIRLGGQVMDARGTPTLAPGESVTLVALLPAEGAVQVQVGKNSITVPVTGGIQPAAEVEQNASGLGLVAAVAALGALAVLRRR